MATGCGTPEVQPLLPNAAPWQDGEVSVFRVLNPDDDYVGTVRYAISRGTETDGWTIQRETVALGDDETVIVNTTGPNLRPASVRLTRNSAQGTERVNTVFDGAQVNMELTTVRDVTTYQTEQVPTDARDQRTVLMLARMLPLASGYAVRFNSYLPVADRLDRITLAVRGREQVSVPAGTFDTWRVRLDTGDSQTEAWIGVDAPSSAGAVYRHAYPRHLQATGISAGR